MKIKFNDKELELAYSFRVNMYFERMMGKSIDFEHFTQEDLLTLFYCVFISTLQKNKMDIIPMLDFMDLIDEQGGDKLFIDFANWYINIMKAQYEVVDSMPEDEENKEQNKKKKSKKKS